MKSVFLFGLTPIVHVTIQEKVAECLEISRQAVTKWEGNLSKPSSDNLIKLASLFDIDVEVLLGNKENNSLTTGDIVTISKAPWIFIGISFATLLIYIILGVVLKILSPGTVITGFVVLIPIQLFLHLYFTYAIKNESFSGLAGYNSKISYDLNALKRILTQIDLNICMSSTVLIFLNCAFDFLHLGYFARPVVYFILLLAGLLATMIVFEAKGIENNTAPAMKVIFLTILGMSFATGGYFFENRNISKWQPGESVYKIDKVV